MIGVKKDKVITKIAKVFLLVCFLTSITVSVSHAATSCQTDADCGEKFSCQTSSLGGKTCQPKKGAGLLGTLIEIGGNTVARFIYVILVIVASFVKLFLYVAAHILDWALALSKTGFTNAAIVATGWAITRSVVNLLFALILLAISFATILRIESYGAKKLLPKLILVALTINFSLFICGTIIDFSQVITTYFIDTATQSGTATDLVAGINPQKADSSTGIIGSALEKLKDGVTSDYPIALMFGEFMGIIILSIAFFVFLFLAFIFIVRIIALWILLILAPIAWVFSVVPGLSGIAQKWWSKFLEYTFIAPAAAFFIFLALQVANSNAPLLANTPEMLMGNVGSQVALKDTAGDIFSAGTFLQYLAIIGLLIAAIIVGKTISSAGANFTFKAMQGTRKFLGNQALKATQSGLMQTKEGERIVGKKGLKAVGRGITGALGYGMRYDITKEALGKAAKRAAEPIEQRASGSVYDKAAKVLSLGKLKTNEQGRAVQNEVKRRQKEWQTVAKSPTFFQERFLKAKDLQDTDAALRLLAAEQTPRELMATLAKDPKIKEKLNLTGKEFSRPDLESALFTAYTLKGQDRKQALRSVADISQIFDKNKFVGFSAMGSWDGESGGPTRKFDQSLNSYVYTGWDQQGKVEYSQEEIDKIIIKNKTQGRDSLAEESRRKYDIHIRQEEKLKKNIQTRGAKKIMSLAQGDNVVALDRQGKQVVPEEGKVIMSEMAKQANIENVKKGKGVNQNLAQVVTNNETLIKSEISAPQVAELVDAIVKGYKEGSFEEIKGEKKQEEK